MEITCQHCGFVASGRVMCPSCGRRMQAPKAAGASEGAAAAGAADYVPPVAAGESATYGAPPPPAPHGAAPAYGAPPPYGAPADLEMGPFGPLSPALLLDRSVITKTRRLTVLVRLVLVIPHVIVLGIVGIAEAFVLVATWFAALFTAQVPPALYKFSAWVTAYSGRVGAYGLLLTDTWPTFDDDAPYPVALQLPGRTRLNRAAVFFRYFLAIPAGILTVIIGYGAAALMFFIWLIVLAIGRVPEPVFDSLARVLRYSIRYRAYYSMLTSAYPKTLFGADPPVGKAPPSGPYTPEPPRYTGGARTMLAAFVVLGVAAIAGLIALSVVQAKQDDEVLQANNRIVSAYKP